MMDTGTQTVSNTQINSRDLSASKNDESLVTVMRTTQTEHVDLQSHDANTINFDRAIISVGRSENNQRLQHNCNRYLSSDISNYSCTTDLNDQQQINVVDQMIAQPQVPYILLPKHFKPKQISEDRNLQKSNLLMNNDDSSCRSRQQNSFQDNEQEHGSMIHRHFVSTNSYYKPHQKDYYNSYSYRPSTNCFHLSFNTIPSQDYYTRSEQQFYGYSDRRNNGGCIRDDHRVNTSKQQSRNNRRAKTYENNNNND